MAASLIRRVISPALLSGSLRPVRAVAQPAVSTRFIHTRAIPEYNSGDESDSDDDRLTFYSYYGGGFGSFPPRGCPTQTPSSMEPLAASDDGLDFILKATADGVYVVMDQPRLGKEDIKLCIEKNTLVLKGEGKKIFEDDEAPPMCNCKIDLADIGEISFKLDAIKAEMKNGVLKVFLPMMKEEEKTDVLHVSVD